MKITVFMSTYNGQRYLKEQIDSILEQEGCEPELIVRDDMSSDDTIEILKEYEKQGKLTWYRDGQNLGAAKSFWSMVQNGPECDYYSFADQDDIWKKDKLIRGIRAIEQAAGPAIYYSNGELADAEGKTMNDVVYHGEQRPSLLMTLCSCNILGCTMVMNRKLAEIIKDTEAPSHIIMHDYYASALCMACGGQIFYDSYPGLYYRQHDNNVVGVKVNRNLMEKIKSKISWILRERKVSVADQCRSLLKCSHLTQEGREYINRISAYKENFPDRFCLAGKLIFGYLTKKATKHELLTAVAMMFKKI